jgi:integrase/recombinase XerD
MCERTDVDPLTVKRAHIAVYVRELTERAEPSRFERAVDRLGLRIVQRDDPATSIPVRLFYDFLVEDGLRDMNPVCRGRYTPRSKRGGHERELVPSVTKLPWIPSELEWLRLLEIAAPEPIRNRLMPALAYDAALRREELCSLRTDDLDPAQPHAARAR